MGDQQVFACHDSLPVAYCYGVLFLIFASRNELGRLVSVADEVMGWDQYISYLIYLTVMSSGGLCPFWTVMTTVSIEFALLPSGQRYKVPSHVCPHRTINITSMDMSVNLGKNIIIITQEMLDRITFFCLYFKYFC